MEVFGLCRLANSSAFTIAAGMRRQIQKNVFPNEWREIDRLRSVQFGMQCEGRDLDVVPEFFETGDATQFDQLFERPVYPTRAFRNSNVDFVLHRPDATYAFGFQLRSQAIFLAFEIQSFRWDLFEMNFHFRILSPSQRLNFFPSELVTTAGTNFEMSPPSRAISFTNRELK